MGGEKQMQTVPMTCITCGSSQASPVYPDSVMPTQATDGSVGYDLYVHHIEDLGDYLKVYTGVSLAPIRGLYFDLVARSSTYKRGLMLANGVGIIDADYRGEIVAVFEKKTHFKGDIKPGDRLVQLIGRQQVRVSFEVVKELDITERKDGAFGSSGN